MRYQTRKEQAIVKKLLWTKCYLLNPCDCSDTEGFFQWWPFFVFTLTSYSDSSENDSLVPVVGTRKGDSNC